MKKQATFEEAISRLETLVSELESGKKTLAESLDAYAEAVALAKSCTTMLDEAEQKIRILRIGEGGEVSEGSFAEEKGDEI